ncbi:MAG: DUF1501 domain-containing protein [Myxococcales bacterium]|nr:DUF1501 domain-containing protein [Myxococcales bacterium]
MSHHPTRRGVLLGASSLALLGVSGPSTHGDTLGPLLLVWVPGGLPLGCLAARAGSLGTPTAVARVRTGASSHASAEAEVLHTDEDPWLERLPGGTVLLAGPAVLQPTADDLQILEEAALTVATGRASAVRVVVPGGWDDHEGRLDEPAAHRELFGALDRALSILDGSPATVVVAGEMGRAPRRNWRGGRNDWHLADILLAGATVRDGARLAERPVCELGTALLARAGVPGVRDPAGWDGLFAPRVGGFA